MIRFPLCIFTQSGIFLQRFCPFCDYKGKDVLNDMQRRDRYGR